MSALMELIDWNKKITEEKYKLNGDTEVYYHNGNILMRCEAELFALHSRIAELEKALTVVLK